MQRALKQTTAPTTEPVLLGQAKEHLLVTQDDDNVLIERLIKQARAYIERQTKRQLITATWEMYLDEFPSGDRTIYIPRAPLQSVSSITYVDDDGDTQVLDPSLYRVDAESTFPRITEAYDQDWPDTRDITNAVTITFVAGYGNTGISVPDDLIGAILLLVGAWYENRDGITVGVQSAPLALGVDEILELYRLVEYA